MPGRASMESQPHENGSFARIQPGKDPITTIRLRIKKRKGDEIDSTFIGMGVFSFLPHEMASSLALPRTR
jgi:hypothetical protein